MTCGCLIGTAKSIPDWYIYAPVCSWDSPRGISLQQSCSLMPNCFPGVKLDPVLVLLYVWPSAFPRIKWILEISREPSLPGFLHPSFLLSGADHSGCRLFISCLPRCHIRSDGAPVTCASDTLPLTQMSQDFSSESPRNRTYLFPSLVPLPHLSFIILARFPVPSGFPKALLPSPSSAPSALYWSVFTLVDNTIKLVQAGTSCTACERYFWGGSPIVFLCYCSLDNQIVHWNQYIIKLFLNYLW